MEMLLEGISAVSELPLVEDFISSLRKCRETKDLDCAYRVYKIIHIHGLESCNALGNHLVPVFVECGDVLNAQQVFHKLDQRKEHSWTSLMQGNIECGHFEHALDMFEKMQDDCVYPSKFTLHNVLRACASLKDVNGAREAHLEISKGGLETDPYVGVSLVDVYAKCGLLLDAEAVFYRLSARNEAMWNALIAAYTDQGLVDEVLNCLQEMHHDGLAPDALMLVHALKACISTESLGKGQELHAEIAQEEFESDRSVGNTLMDMYVKSGLLEEARAVLDELSSRDVVSWTTLMAGYAEQEFGAEVLKCLEQMLSDGIIPNDVTYICALKACSSIGALHDGHKLHTEIAAEGFENSLSVGTSLVDMYAKFGSLAESLQVFEELPCQDVVSWNVIIAAYVENEYIDEAFKCLVQMRIDGVVANTVTYTSILKGCCSMGRLEKGREVCNELVIEGFEADAFVGCFLIDMFAKFGSLVEAQDVFDDLTIKGVVAWTALISGYVEHGFGVEAVRYLNQMQMEGVIPNAATFVCILKACSTLEDEKKAQELHMDVVKRGLENLPHVGCSLIDMYAKCDLLAEAQDVFDGFPERDLVSWNALMSGYAEHGVTDEVFNMFEKLQLRGMSPDASTYVCTLKVCGSTGDSEKGRDLHMEIVKKGLEARPFVGNMLVDMYVKCSSVEEAQVVFEGLTTHDVVSWNTLIVGYAEHELFDEALSCQEQMLQEGVCKDMITFVFSLKACSCIGATGKGHELHTELVKLGLEDDSSLHNTLMDMYINCGTLAEARHIFGDILFRDVVSWNVLIGGYVEQSHSEEVLVCLEKMYTDGISPNDVTFILALKACCSESELNKGYEMHAEILKGGFDGDFLVWKALLDMYCKCGFLLEAQKAFNYLPCQDAGSWNTMLSGYVLHGCDEEAIVFMKQMELKGISPDPITFDNSLKACSSLRALGLGQEAHLCITKRGFDGDASVANNLLHMYVHCASLTEADDLLSELVIQDAVSWDALIAVYVKHGLDDEVLRCFDMAFCEGGAVSPFLFVCSLKACSNIRAIGKGQELHVQVITEGLEVNTRISNVLVHMYAKCGLLAEAQDIFDNIEVQGVAAWTSLVAGCVDHGSAQEALICLEQMQVAGVPANAVTFVFWLKACSNLGSLRKGQEVHTEIIIDGLEHDHYVGSTLVDMYVKCGLFAEALDVFKSLDFGNVVPWNILITGYANRGFGEDALDCMEQMLLEGVSPNAVTYVCGLKACGSIGAYDKGRELHLEIAIEGYELDSFIGNMLVDMYARCGALLEASEMFEELSIKNLVSWTALIAGYSSQGESELVCSLFERMIRTGIRPDGITLLCVLSVCSHAGYIEKGLMYFNLFSGDKCIMLTVEHFNCVVDLLSRAGQLKECLSVIERMPCQPNFVTWRTVLGACRKWGNVELGKHAFECAMVEDKIQIGACILMYNIYVEANMWEDAMKIDLLIQSRKQVERT